MKERQPRKFVFGSKIDVSKTNMAASSVAGGSGTFIGFDFSTQQIKAVVIDDRLNVVQEAHVQLDSDLPEYRTHGGVYIHEDRKTVTSPTIMWVKGLDMLMDRLRVKGVDISAIKGLSGTAQQHGTVYWKKGARDLLKSLDPDRYLHEQLFDAFAIRESPIWMDSSTTAFCKEFEEKLGSPQRVADITGARAFERASGMQIGKIYHTMPDAYMATERISLVSSFACSLFLGDYAPIDTGDGSGMNLLDIHQKDWSAECLDAVAPDLREKLGEVEYASKCLGHIAPYFVERYSFDPQCKVITFTGDNLSSLAGICMKDHDVAVSLGTSDVVFACVSDPQPALEGNLFCSPINTDGYMLLLCYKNGSLTRERIRDKFAEGSWDIFTKLLESIPRGNFGNIGMYWDKEEIVPPLVKGDFRFNKADLPAASGSFPAPEMEIRALVEGQFLSKRLHCQRLGFTISPSTRILATGGASKNTAILQVLADVFNAPVYVQGLPNSACLGAAFRAKHVATESHLPYHESVTSPGFQLICEPNGDAQQVYDELLKRYEELEDGIAARFSQAS